MPVFVFFVWSSGGLQLVLLLYLIPVDDVVVLPWLTVLVVQHSKL